MTQIQAISKIHRQVPEIVESSETLLDKLSSNTLWVNLLGMEKAGG